MNGSIAVAKDGPATPLRVYIILVNWNGWQDTIECLESVFRITYPAYTVIVCDNASANSSIESISRWAVGKLAAGSRNPKMAEYSSPAVNKPIVFVEVASVTPPVFPSKEVRLVLIQTGANLGFAAANNIGIDFALKQEDAAYLWFLNNDTVVRPDSLSRLVGRMKEEPGAGLCGSTLLFYDDPEHIQACGGSRYNHWTARGGHIAAGRSARDLPSRDWVEHQLGYIVGASMLASRSFVETVGPMSEDYFLYFEEVDWATRARGRFTLAYAPLSVVYHKTGASIGSAARSLHQSEAADYWGTRNRIAFTRDHFRYALFSVYCFVLASALLRLLHGRVKNCLAVLSGAFWPAIPKRWDVSGRSDRGKS